MHLGNMATGSASACPARFAAPERGTALQHSLDTQRYPADKSPLRQQGKAFLCPHAHGPKRTANGENHDQNAMLAAHAPGISARRSR